jgi:hypothetical protein
MYYESDIWNRQSTILPVDRQDVVRRLAQLGEAAGTAGLLDVQCDRRACVKVPLLPVIVTV